MQVSLTEGLCLRFGAVSLFLTIACESLNTVRESIIPGVFDVPAAEDPSIM